MVSKEFFQETKNVEFKRKILSNIKISNMNLKRNIVELLLKI